MNRKPSTYVRARCDSCQIAYINGVRCHETGCPRAWEDSIEECMWCGAEYRPTERGQAFCDTACKEAYYC